MNKMFLTQAIVQTVQTVVVQELLEIVLTQVTLLVQETAHATQLEIATSL